MLVRFVVLLLDQSWSEWTSRETKGAVRWKPHRKSHLQTPKAHIAVSHEIEVEIGETFRAFCKNPRCRRIIGPIRLEISD
jgi:hypothetical protein